MSIIFIILTLVLVLAVVIYIIGSRRGSAPQSTLENKDAQPVAPTEDEDDDTEI